MNNSAPVQLLKDITSRPLAPVIPLKTAPKQESKPKKRVPTHKLEEDRQQFYNKPIYRSKKYDLL